MPVLTSSFRSTQRTDFFDLAETFTSPVAMVDVDTGTLTNTVSTTTAEIHEVLLTSIA